MESNRAVLGNPGNGRSGMSICIVVHVMKIAYKYVEVLLAFAVASYSFTSTRMYPYLSLSSGWSVMFTVSFIKRPLFYHSNNIFSWGLLP